MYVLHEVSRYVTAQPFMVAMDRARALNRNRRWLVSSEAWARMVFA